MMRYKIGLTLMAALLLQAAPAYAQKMYRCGSVYQDRPCEGTKEGREVRNFAGTASAGGSISVVDAECRQRGVDAQKIAWLREAGATANKQMNDVTARGAGSRSAEEERRLIEVVYQMQGSAPQVRTAIEAECLATKQRAAPTIASAPTSATPVAGPAPDAKAAEAAQKEASSRQDAARQQEMCKGLEVRLIGIKSDLRRGGSVTTMENLQQQQRDVEDQKRQARC